MDAVTLRWLVWYNVFMDTDKSQEFRKRKTKKPDLDTRIGKYFVARKAGKNKKESQIVAGFPDANHSHRIENTQSYQILEQTYYKDEMLKKITLAKIAEEHIKNIVQDQDKGAKNKAIEMALGRIEPDIKKEEEVDKVLVILRPAQQ